MLNQISLLIILSTSAVAADSCFLLSPCPPTGNPVVLAAGAVRCARDNPLNKRIANPVLGGGGFLPGTSQCGKIERYALDPEQGVIDWVASGEACGDFRSGLPCVEI